MLLITEKTILMIFLYFTSPFSFRTENTNQKSRYEEEYILLSIFICIHFVALLILILVTDVAKMAFVL